MPTTENQLFEKFTKLANAVRQDFKRKGIVPPSQKKDGAGILVMPSDTIIFITTDIKHSMLPS